MADSVWDHDYRVLDYLTKSFITEGLPFTADDIGAIAEGMDTGFGALKASLLRLYNADPPYLTADPETPAEEPVPAPIGVTERGLRATGAWPAGREADPPPAPGRKGLLN